MEKRTAMGVELEKSVLTNPATILIIDDDETIRFSLSKKLSKHGYNVVSADKAEDALYLLKNDRQKIDFVVTDIRLRKMDGIELLRHITSMDNPVPVLLTGQGNIEDAVNALRYGACDFIRKPFDVGEVANVVRSVLKRKDEERLTLDLGQHITNEKRDFLLPSDINLGNIVSFVATANLPKMGICNRATAENVSLALREAITNAMFHGNLEISSEIREREGIKAFNDLIEIKKNENGFKDRRVSFHYEITREYAEYVIRDQGRGFDHTKLPDPRDPENFFNKSGRGILIIQLHMDEVVWSENGSCIRMKKNKVE
jgi:FixJ family two-component response regulator/anti-sigma regulatory factor (Ser/Thr protein kinase)